MSKIEVDQITQQSGTTVTVGGGACKTAVVDATTVTLGRSGGTVSLASGATQSGFGREGSVNWQTSIKTATFTAASGEGYFCNTSGGAFTVNLPSSPSVGDIVAIKDYASTFDTNNLTIGRGGSNMNGAAADSVRDTENESLTLVYADATKGWLAVEEGTGFVGETFVSATGGVITTSGDFKIHTFTGPGTFTVSQLAGSSPLNVVDYLVVAGGGGTPGLEYNNTPSGGGGAGGLRASATTFSIGCNPAKPLVCGVSALPVSIQGYPIVVGGGGAGGSAGPGNAGANGSTSSFSTISSAGGGVGGHNSTGPGANGGSGGGGGQPYPAGTGNTPPVSPAQGTPGGVGVGFPTNPSPGSDNTGLGGGGGAIQPGFSGGNQTPGGGGGDGGDGAGFTNGAFGSSNGETVSCVQYFAGGGGGGVYTPNPSPNPGGIGGLGGGGNGGSPSQPTSITNPARTGQAGTANTGGGGGSSGGAPSPSTPFVGQAGGSGIVIIRYKFQ